MAKQYFKAVSLLALLAMMLAFVPAGSVRAVEPPLPTVDGLYLLSGDDEHYYYLGPTTQTRGTIYYLLDHTDLYLAIVVSETVNDNVFGMKGADGDYMDSANWNAVHTAASLIGSDHLEIALQCGDNNWDWFQDYVYDPNYEPGGTYQYDPNPGDENPWLSDPYGPDGGGNPPPGLVTASSMQWNFNHSTWDETLGDPARSAPNAWKSPDVDGDNDVVTDGWPDFRTDPDWEWKMVYEMKIDVSACGSDKITVWPVSAHNSPAKDGEEDIPFEPVDLMDLGDVPDTYGTLVDSDGARHPIVVDGPYLGVTEDAEDDGQPDLYALGDDEADWNDDEDGVVFMSPLTPGYTAAISVTAWFSGSPALLDAWVDFNGNGVFDSEEQIFTSLNLALGQQYLTFEVPGTAIMGWTYLRFRISTDGGLGPTGPALDGEVEDYVRELVPTAVDLLSFTAYPEGPGIAVRWETASEIDNAGFNLYRATSLEGEKTRLNGDLIPSKVPPGSTIGAAYSWLDNQVMPGTVYYYWLEDVDIYGRATLHGPVKAKAPALRLLPARPSLTDR